MIQKLPEVKPEMKLPNLQAKSERLVELFGNALRSWLSRKETGHLTFEIHTSQGGITHCYHRTSTEVKLYT